MSSTSTNTLMKFDREIAYGDMATRLKEWQLCGCYLFVGSRGEFPTEYLPSESMDQLTEDADRIEVFEKDYWREVAIYDRYRDVWRRVDLARQADSD